MRWFTSIALLVLFHAMSVAAEETKIPNVVLGVHGGTGMDKHDLTPELDKQFRAKLEEALRAGYAILQKPTAATGAGKTPQPSLDATEASIRVLEDSPLFNAGKGAVFTHEGRNELDASIMEGRTKRAGAVAGVTVIKNPISAARAVMDQSRHVLMVGRGAEVFATRAGLEIVDPAYFWTERRWKDLQKAWQAESNREKGTVGAVALDRNGDLAAGTSTGGMTNKQFGRVGDSPIIGAGTYADNEACAVSCTGHGEFFIRYAVSHDIACLVKYKGLTVKQAAEEVVNKTLKKAGGEGGVIALDPQGNFAMSYNSEGLYRGYITTDGTVRVHLYED